MPVTYTFTNTIIPNEAEHFLLAITTLSIPNSLRNLPTRPDQLFCLIPDVVQSKSHLTLNKLQQK